MQNSLWILKIVWFWLKEFLRDVEVLEELLNTLILFLDVEKLIFFVVFKSLEFFVEVFLQLEDNGLDQLNLISLSHISVKLEWLVEQLKDIGIIDSVFELFEWVLLETDFPMHLLHTFDLKLLDLVFGCQSCLLIGVLLLGLATKFTLGDLKNWHLLVTLGGTSWVIKNLLLVLSLRLFGLFEKVLSSRFGDTLIILEERLASGSVHQIALKELGEFILIKRFLQFGLYSIESIKQLHLSHVYDLV